MALTTIVKIFFRVSEIRLDLDKLCFKMLSAAKYCLKIYDLQFSYCSSEVKNIT